MFARRIILIMSPLLLTRRPAVSSLTAAGTLVHVIYFSVNAILGMPLPYDSIDWFRHGGRLFVVLDPNAAKTGRMRLLYLTEAAYLSLSKVCLSNNIELEVLALPEDTPDTVKELSESSSVRVPTNSKKPDQKSPPLLKGRRLPAADFFTESASVLEVPEETPGTRYIRAQLSGLGARLISPLHKESGVRIVDNLVSPSTRNLGRVLSIWAARLAHWLGLKYQSPLFAREVKEFSAVCVEILRNSGSLYLALYLKASAIIVNSYLGELPLTSNSDLPVRVGLTKGLPSFLPRRWRQFIRDGNINWIRFIGSLLAVYRSLKTPEKPADFTTIGSPPAVANNPGECLVLLSFFGKMTDWMSDYSSWFTLLKLKPNFDSDPQARSFSSGPNARPSFKGAGLDLHALIYSGEASAVYAWVKLMVINYGAVFWNKWQAAREDVYVGSAKTSKQLLSERSPETLGTWRDVFVKKYNLFVEQYFETRQSTAKVSVKYEAAGKVRVFAIVDWWTQILLSPFHRAVERVLRSLPQDATFDQDGKTAEFASRDYPLLWSYDLKSATDMISSALYVPLVDALTGIAGSGEAWVSLLTNRDYWYKPNAKVDKPSKNPQTILPGSIRSFFLAWYGWKGDRVVRYTRGQPMGAKSSWPMLALLHHNLVWFSAWRAGIRKPLGFRDYLILGDDIVIADPLVAIEYRKLTLELGIPVSITKSFAGAKRFFQFANQNWWKGINISPTSLKADLSVKSVPGRLEFARSLLQRWGSDSRKTSLTSCLQLLVDGAQWKVISSEMSRWAFGLSGETLLRVLLTPGSTLVESLGDTGASVLLWLSSFHRGLSTSEVLNVLSREGAEGLSPSAALLKFARRSVTRVSAAVANTFARLRIQELLNAMIVSRENLGILKDMHKGSSNRQGYELDAHTNVYLYASEKLALISEQVFGLLLPLLPSLYGDTHTEADAAANIGLINSLVDTVPTPPSTTSSRETSANPYDNVTYAKILAPAIIEQLRLCGVHVEPLRRITTQLPTKVLKGPRRGRGNPAPRKKVAR